MFQFSNGSVVVAVVVVDVWNGLTNVIEVPLIIGFTHRRIQSACCRIGFTFELCAMIKTLAPKNNPHPKKKESREKSKIKL